MQLISKLLILYSGTTLIGACTPNLNVCFKIEGQKVLSSTYKLCEKEYGLGQNSQGLWQNASRIDSCDSKGKLTVLYDGGEKSIETSYAPVVNFTEYAIVTISPSAVGNQLSRSTDYKGQNSSNAGLLKCEMAAFKNSK